MLKEGLGLQLAAFNFRVPQMTTNAKYTQFLSCPVSPHLFPTWAEIVKKCPQLYIKPHV